MNLKKCTQIIFQVLNFLFLYLKKNALPKHINIPFHVCLIQIPLRFRITLLQGSTPTRYLNISLPFSCLVQQIKLKKHHLSQIRRELIYTKKGRIQVIVMHRQHSAINMHHSSTKPYGITKSFEG